MSFAGLKQRADEADRARQAAEFDRALAADAVEESNARALVRSAEERVEDAVAEGRRELLVIRLEANRDFVVPRAKRDQLTRGSLKGTALRTYDLLAQRREALPVDQRFDIDLGARSLEGRGDPGYGYGWDAAIYIKW